VQFDDSGENLAITRHRGQEFSTRPTDRWNSENTFTPHVEIVEIVELSGQETEKFIVYVYSGEERRGEERRIYLEL